MYNYTQQIELVKYKYASPHLVARAKYYAKWEEFGTRHLFLNKQTHAQKKKKYASVR